MEPPKKEVDDVEIKIVDTALMPTALDFMYENFFADEPISRSLGVRRGKAVNFYVNEILKKGESQAAFDGEGNMLGLRGGGSKNRDNWLDRFFETGFIMKRIFPVILRMTGGIRIDDYIKVQDALGFNPWKLMDDKNCSKIWEGLCICTSRQIRSRGLGTRLVAASMELAKENGCEYMYVLVTGNYSAKIFDKLGFSVENELVYDEFRDENGELILKDVREHIKAQVRLKKL